MISIQRKCRSRRFNFLILFLLDGPFVAYQRRWYIYDFSYIVLFFILFFLSHSVSQCSQSLHFGCKVDAKIDYCLFRLRSNIQLLSVQRGIVFFNQHLNCLVT